MNNNNTIEKTEKRLARPLKVLVPMIKRDIENAEHAGKMFYIAAGGKLIEAKSQLEYGGWGKWLKDNFDFHHSTAAIWMGWWEAENVRGEEFQTQEEFRRATNSTRKQNSKRKYRDYHEPVDRILSGINSTEMHKRSVDAAKEHELERKLAKQLISIGYGVLATKLHPDKGGSSDAMRRLSKVVKTLRSVYGV